MNSKKQISKTRRTFLEKTKVTSQELRVVLKSLGLKDNSLQLYFFLNSLLNSYSPGILEKFFPFVSERIRKGILSFRSFKFPVEEFYKELSRFASGLVFKYRRLKRLVVIDNKCPKCGKELHVGELRCKKCKTLLKWE